MLLDSLFVMLPIILDSVEASAVNTLLTETETDTLTSCHAGGVKYSIRI